MDKNKTMNYEQTKELEENIKIKNEAEETYKKFLRNIKLEVKNYRGDGRFMFWKDEHNATFFRIDSDGEFVFECRFLHETYDVRVTKSALFHAIKTKYKGYYHLKSAVRDK